MLNWIEVESSAVEQVAYDDGRNDLHVEFEGGAHYRYSGVEPDEFHRLLGSASIGAFINRDIKPHHPYEELPSTALPHRPRSKARH